ncbi:MAG: TIGR04282 family arsenosugar biosynthesis glycosyltransferase [Acidocella sp.]|nr:TIGR04282 family arsenosugar biosynthesis glycosyltransferase [Acidocella sp.]
MTDLPHAATCAIAVMAKVPQPGRSKTRLVPPLTSEQAAGLSAAFLRDITENIVAASRMASIQGFIAYAPQGLEALFDGHIADGTQLVLADGNIDSPDGIHGFGRCLLHAIRSLLDRGYGSAVVLNSDSPTLPTSILARTAASLALPGDRAVLGPAEDGGYYLLGLKTAHAYLFEDIAWSTENVALQTAQRAREVGLELIILPTWYDVDDAAALYRLIDDFETAVSPDDPSLLPFAAPATNAFLAPMGLNLDAFIKKTA